MPFALNEATRFISPTKTPEFPAAGVPVVCTPIADVVRPYGERGLVEIGAGTEAFVSAAEALLRRPREEWLGRVDAHLSAMSWDAIWAEMDGAVRSLDRTTPRMVLKAAARMVLPKATAAPSRAL